jgi:mannose-1-phosphate guanylyltransferase
MPPLAFAVILAGGYGTRFWPASRRTRPKQFLPLLGKESLLQMTCRRVARLFPRNRIYVVGNAEHRALLRRQLPHLPKKNLLLEPVGRNTAAAVALAAAHIRSRSFARDLVLAVFPADHTIRSETRFTSLVRAALAAARREEALVVLGVPPTHAHTGFGYIERGERVPHPNRHPIFAVRRFTEKPDARTAARYVRSGRFYWNSGMFFWRLSTFERLLRRYLPRTAAPFARPVRSLSRLYRRLPGISLDYALAEPAARAGLVRVIPAQMGWSDLGSWSALADWLGPRGSARFALDRSGRLLRATEKPGADNFIVVETPDAGLVCRRDRAQDVGKIVELLEKEKLHRWL